MAGTLPANQSTLLSLSFDTRSQLLAAVLQESRQIFLVTGANPPAEAGGNRIPAVGWQDTRLITWVNLSLTQQALMYSCRQLYEESIPHVMRHADLCFNTPKGLYVFLAHVEAINPNNLNYVRRIRLLRPTFPYSSMALNKLHRCENVDHATFDFCRRCRETRTVRINPSLMRKWRNLRHRDPTRRWARNVVVTRTLQNLQTPCGGCRRYAMRHPGALVRFAPIVLRPYPAGLGWAANLAPPGRITYQP